MTRLRTSLSARKQRGELWSLSDHNSPLCCLNGAGDRDRTGMASLEGWGSTIELHPRSCVNNQEEDTHADLSWSPCG